MKEIHIFTSPISQTSTVVLGEEQEPSESELHPVMDAFQKDIMMWSK
jgi:hypothetical protein